MRALSTESNDSYELIVYSLDYDGCIAPHASKDCMANMMQHMIDMLKRHVNANLILMVGSARQSIHSDIYHQFYNKNGSCLVFLNTFFAGFKSSFSEFEDRVSLCPFLLEDIENKTKPGFHFEKRVDFSGADVEAYANQHDILVTKNFDHIRWHDHHKKAMIYAQMHHIAVQYQNKRTLFQFF